MTKLPEIAEYLKRYAVFDITALSNKIDKDRKYSILFMHRLRKRLKIHKIEKNKFTMHDDPFLIASRIIWPSYISCWSALKYHNLTEQLPHDIWVIATKNKKAINFRGAKIRFIKIKNKNFFGYDKARYNNFEIFIANHEKSVIDSALLNKISFSEIKEIVSNNIKKLNKNRLLSYLKRINNKSLIKRFGYVLEELGFDYYNKFKKYIDPVYVPLDNSKEIKGKSNKKWRLIINA